MKPFNIALFFLVSALISLLQCQIVFTSSDASNTNKPYLRGVEGGLDSPGNGEFKFFAYHKISSSSSGGVQQLEILMTLNQTLLQFDCSDNYVKYHHVTQSSSLMEFKYYKSCITNGLATPSFQVVAATEQNKMLLRLALTDTFDKATVYNFDLKQQDMSFEEKIDVIFNTMKNEIATLKDTLWFLDSNTNKLDPKRMVSSIYNANFNAFLKGTSSSYTGIYTSPIGFSNRMKYTASSTYDFNSGQYIPGIIKIDFPLRINMSIVEIELKNGGSCPYTDPINFLPFMRWGAFSSSFYSSSSTEIALNNFESIVTTKIPSTDGYTLLRSKVVSSVMPDIFFFSISSNGHTSPNGQFDGRCNYVIRSMKIY